MYNMRIENIILASIKQGVTDICLNIVEQEDDDKLNGIFFWFYYPFSASKHVRHIFMKSMQIL